MHYAESSTFYGRNMQMNRLLALAVINHAHIIAAKATGRLVSSPTGDFGLFVIKFPLYLSTSCCAGVTSINTQQVSPHLVTFEPWQPHGTWLPWKPRITRWPLQRWQVRGRTGKHLTCNIFTPQLKSVFYKHATKPLGTCSSRLSDCVVDMMLTQAYQHQQKMTA